MAKLLKHLGIGGKRPTPNSPKLEYDPQRFDRSKPSPITDHHLTGNDTGTDSSSTVSSVATVGSDEFPPPPSVWTLQQALASESSGVAFGGARPKDAKALRQQGDVERQKFGAGSSTDTADSDFMEIPKIVSKKSKDTSETAHIYENQVMFDTSMHLVNKESLQEVKKWLDDVNLDVGGNSRASRLGFDPPIRSSDKIQSPRLDRSRKTTAATSSSPSEKAVDARKVSAAKTRDNKAAYELARKEELSRKEMESEYEKSNPATREPDYERYTQLRDELKLELEELAEITEEEPVSEQEEAFDLPVLPCEENQMVRSDGYEEPWDLEAAQVEIEDQFNGVLVGEWILRENPADKKATATSGGQSTAAVVTQLTPSAGQSGPPPHELDIRTQRGYEKPWDWKPHQKDDRGPEGYEKPWDWKPHQKDDRPTKEYEEPWDRKGKNVENEVIAAKIAKEAAKAGKDPAALAAAAAALVASQGKGTTEDARGQDGYDKPWDLKPHLKDSRPPDEYEEPWDTKSKDIESELIAAKIAKEAAKAAASAAADMASGDQLISPGLAVADRVVRRQTKDGGRVSNEAVDVLKKSNQILRTASEEGAKPIRPLVLSPAQGIQRPSPKKKPGLTPDLDNISRSRIGERIQTKIPLKEQGWYHGTISRGDAESILKGRTEGSYLVRHSESGTDEFSLSVKSSRGFMHMKIVLDRDGKFILGQFSQPFPSIPQMIQYYTVSKLPIKGAEHISLLFPVGHKPQL